MPRNRNEDGEESGLTYTQKLLKQKMAESKRRSKYNNTRVRYKDRWFDSIYEMNAAKSLEAMRRAKQERDRVVAIEYQVKFPIVVNKAKICDYVADFVVEFADGRIDVIDAKGMRTAVYRLKQKMMLAVHGIKIVEM